MRWLIAPAPFKESLTADEAAAAIHRGMRRVFSKDDYNIFPIADGGSGFLHRIVSAQKGEVLSVPTTNAAGQPIIANYGLVEKNSKLLAVIESAEACGLAGLPQNKRDPTATSTYGLGAVLMAAAAHSPDEIIVGCGDSATNDGGAGVASALGAAFLTFDGEQIPVPPKPEALRNLSRIELRDCPEWIGKIPITVACNLTSLLLGPEGTTRIYGPQKGLAQARIPTVESGLERLSEVLFDFSGLDLSRFPGAGASGGLAASLIALFQANVRYSMAVISEFLDFEGAIKECDAVVTGEGLTDARTFSGKAPGYLALLAKKHAKPVFCISGGQTAACENSYFNGIDAVHSATPAPMPTEHAIASAAVYVESAGARLARTIAAARGLPQ